MEPSSTQNPTDEDSSDRVQKSLQNDVTHENSKANNSVDTAGTSSSAQKKDVTENKIISAEESHFDPNNEERKVNNLEKVTNPDAEVIDNTQNPKVITVYETRHRIRQPFLTQAAANQRIAAPPPYYKGHSQSPSQGNVSNSSKTTQEREHRLQISTPFTGELMLFPNIFLNPVQWAPYPTQIPANIPPGLAHLVDAEALFIVQKIDFLNLIAAFPDLNMYLIQNLNNEYLYYAYETTDLCGQFFCRNARNLQLHIVDMYQNEVIYLNKPCGCTHLCCCFPLIEVYAPPMIPVGAVIKVYHPCREEFIILDPDENEIFKIYGESTLKHCCCCFEFNFSIHALDSQKTVVGYIRRDFGGYFRTFFADADLYGISFPKNMDARIKAVFLGALFLIQRIEKKNWRVFQTGDKSDFKKGGEKVINKIRENDENLKMSIPSNSANVINFLQLIGKLKSLKRTGWVLRNVEDPETVSGHMYRMSIMTFLIPESSGVDKTRCMKLSLVHDLAECIVGDLTPYCGVDTSEKHRQEEVAMKELTQMIGDSGIEIYKLYKEYEAQVTEESKFVKDLDRLDMILQAFEYEKLKEKPGKLEEFFASTINKFHFPWTMDIVKEIYKQRNLHINKDKNLGKDP